MGLVGLLTYASGSRMRYVSNIHISSTLFVLFFFIFSCKPCLALFYCSPLCDMLLFSSFFSLFPQASDHSALLIGFADGPTALESIRRGKRSREKGRRTQRDDPTSPTDRSVECRVEPWITVKEIEREGASPCRPSLAMEKHLL